MTHHAGLLYASKNTGNWEAVCSALLPGAHLILVGDRPDWERVSLQARKVGLSCRDAFTSVSTKGVTFYPVFRKDLSEGTVLNQVLKTGTGAFNIDASRVYTDWNEPDRPDSWKSSGFTNKPEAVKIAAPPGQGINCHPKGRWPPNVGFQHTAECVQDGIKHVQTRSKGGLDVMGATAFGLVNDDGWKASHITFTRVQNEKGEEPIANWKCTASCPVRQLDSQSGTLKSGDGVVRQKPFKGYSGGGGQIGTVQLSYGDDGGASRFFKQFTSEDDVLNYLVRLVLPTDGLLLTEFP